MNSDWLTTVDNTQPLFFILGPCSIENEQHTFKVAEHIKKLAEKLQFHFVFKSSYDKANRLSPTSGRGVGIDQGLEILSKVRSTFDVPIITDVHETEQVNQVATVADIIQIPAMLCRQTDLLLAAGKTGKPVMVKKGQFLSAENMDGAVKKIASTGNDNIWLCERGFTFGYNNLVVDYRNFPIMKEAGKPVVFDATHSVQRPGGRGNSSGGDRKFVPHLAAAAITQGIAGIFMEVHDNPEQAVSDGPNSVRLSQLEDLLKYLIELDNWVKQRTLPELF
ncbi:MAG: 3-deoxy-8-phosphooctulonate synthase [Epsilonproteobacteria bacterium]|nr:3-deoxy-8-phosphooctulonate synthase [Campylobacterota bacterium]